MKTQKVIVYRSQSEALADEFFQDNPFVVLGFLGTLILVYTFFRFRGGKRF